MSLDLDQIFAARRQGTTPPAPLALTGVFDETLSDPSDPAYVRIEAVDGGVSRIGPAYWMPRADNPGPPTFPTAGDPCLVTFDEVGTPWVIAWSVSDA